MVTGFPSTGVALPFGCDTILNIMPARLTWIGLLCSTLTCSDAPLYYHGELRILPDRVNIVGEVCTEDTGSSNFPVKILLAVDSSVDMFSADVDGSRFTGPLGSIQTVRKDTQHQPHIRLGFMGVAGTARPVPAPDGQRFFSPQDPEVDTAIAQLQVPMGNRRDVVNAIAQVQSFIMRDLASATPGAIVRSRYLVSMLFAGSPTPAVGVHDVRKQVERLAKLVYDEGALEFRLNTGVLSGSVDLTGRSVYAAMATAGGGEFREFATAPSIDFNVAYANAGVQLVRKDIIVFNRNVVMRQNDSEVDSDGDGMTDAEELAAVPATDPVLYDTDGDGLGDRLEFRTFPQQDPTDPQDRPQSCVDPALVVALPDSDLDLLTDCEEDLLQTSQSVPDSDGDGLPDMLEFLAGTIPTAAEDRLLDFDGDGVQNAEEVLAHTNPRVHDVVLHGRQAYHNEINDLGMRSVPTMEDPAELRGIVFRRGSPKTLGGQAYVKWDPCTKELFWSDTRYGGNPSYDPVPTIVNGSGTYRLVAQAWDRTPGQPERLIDEIWAELDVVEELMPPCTGATQVESFPLITVSDRNCYRVDITNVRLMETQPIPPDTVRGINRILIFFTQAPKTRITSPGIAKVAEVKAQFICTNPDDLSTCSREPSDGEIDITDLQFVSALP